MRKRKYRKSHNANFIIMVIFTITFLFIGLAYANTNYEIKIGGTARIASEDSSFTLALSRSALDLGIGESFQLTATVNPDSGNEVINWSSSNQDIVTVDSKGIVTGIAIGNATIIAEYNGVKATCLVTVTGDTIIDYSDYLTVTIDYDNIDSNTIWWSTITITNTSGVNFATWSCDLVFPNGTEYDLQCWTGEVIDINGNTFSGTNLASSVTLNGRISLMLGYQMEKYLPVQIKNVKVTFEESEVEATGIHLNTSAITILEGETTSLSANLTPINASNPIEWSSSDETIATVKNGLVRGIKEGSAIITATIDSVSATCSVTVEKSLELKNIILSDIELELQVGDSQKITATKEPANSYGEISWYSSDTNVVTVDSTGNVKAVGIGNAIVTAQYGNVSADCTIIVSEQSFDGWLTATLDTVSVEGNAIYYGAVKFSNNTQYDFKKWSATLVWPDGVTTSNIQCNSDNAANDIECTINGNTYSGGFFIYGTTIQFVGQFFLPEGMTWNDYPAGELELKDIKIEY